MKMMRKLALLCAGCLAFTAMTAGLPMNLIPPIDAKAFDNIYLWDKNETVEYWIVGGVARVSSCNENAEGQIEILSEIYGVPVVHISGYAFHECTHITSIKIPDSITSIGWHAFSYCTALTSITIPDGVTDIPTSAFENCTSLLNITIPESVTEIGWHAFSYCTALTSITIPDGVTEISPFAFESCTSLLNITIPESVTEIGESAFSGCRGLTSVVIPGNDTRIGKNAFSGCNGVISLEIGAGAAQYQDIYNDLPLSSPKLESVTVSPDNPEYSSADGVLFNKDKTTIIRYPMSKKDESTYILPDSVTKIGMCAFSGCESLTSVTIPDSATEIGGSAFSECTNLAGIIIPDSVTVFGGGAFSKTPWLETRQKSNPLVVVNGVLIDGSTCKGDVIIPENVRIGASAFYECTGLTSVSIPDNVTEIGAAAFYRCTDLTSINIPNGISEISAFTFWGCLELASIVIPEGVTSIGDSAFSRCRKLTGITIPESVTTIHKNAFDPLFSRVTIRGYSGSYAEAFAQSHNIKFESLVDAPEPQVKYGDVNDDGSVDLKDVTELRRALADWDVTINEKAADVNRDGSLDLKDLVILRRYLAGGWGIEL
ncbi:MAG: leucine-rich repeat protein [Oscillospiraceae bacterium]|nr:leucine-rich repeat protein [Oscillospiraceae bacterium]MBR4200682.1 leucine-rich repeat protein [Oscillospiraceae bacterium]